MLRFFAAARFASTLPNEGQYPSTLILARSASIESRSAGSFPSGGRFPSRFPGTEPGTSVSSGKTGKRPGRYLPPQGFPAYRDRTPDQRPVRPISSAVQRPPLPTSIVLASFRYVFIPAQSRYLSESRPPVFFPTVPCAARLFR